MNSMAEKHFVTHEVQLALRSAPLLQTPTKYTREKSYVIDPRKLTVRAFWYEAGGWSFTVSAEGRVIRQSDGLTSRMWRTAFWDIAGDDLSALPEWLRLLVAEPLEQVRRAVRS